MSLGVRAGVPDLHTQTCLPSQSVVTRSWLSLPGASALSRILAGRQSQCGPQSSLPSLNTPGAACTAHSPKPAPPA